MSTNTNFSPQTLIAPSFGNPQWFAVHTASRHEKQTSLHLASRGIEHLLPLYEEVHRWVDRQMRVQLPLFPGYLFVHINLLQKMDVLRVPGVARLVGFQGGPMPVSDLEIEAIRRGVTSGISLSPHPYLKTGCRVRVRSGPMTGLQGILIRCRNTDRLVISVDLIMKSVALEIDAADVETIS